MIIDELTLAAEKLSNGKLLSDLIIGVGYTVAALNDGTAGMAFTFRGELGKKCSLIDEAGTLAGRGCKEFLPWAKGTSLAKASVGLAVINALFQKSGESWQRGDALQELQVKPEDTLGMIGYFKPIADQVAVKVSKLMIFERNGTEEENVYPDWAADMYLPQCDVVIITGTTLLNKTMDHILEKCRSAREIAVIGPSAPLYPETFKKKGVSLLGGILVRKPLKVMQILSEGGGARNLGDNVEQVFRRL